MWVWWVRGMRPGKSWCATCLSQSGLLACYYYFTPAVELESGCSSGNSRRRKRRQNKHTDSGLGRPWSGMKIGFDLDSIVKILVE